MHLLLVIFVRQILPEAFEKLRERVLLFRLHLSPNLLKKFHDESRKFYKHILSIFKLRVE